jgi:hypothetical protein
MRELKNIFPVEPETACFPDLTRLRIENQINTAKNEVQREVARSLLYLYDRGEIEVSSDPCTGELMFQAAYIN